LHGWLEKKSSKGFFESWKRIFVTCNQYCFRYYSDHTQKLQKGVIDFNEIHADIV
jgi:hypothetical protein